jgi:protein-tyrosine phosphatase
VAGGTDGGAAEVKEVPSTLTVVQPKWIDLEGVANLRDVGGLPTVDGGTIATGRLLRSDNLQTLTPADVERLLELGLTDVVDLRSDYEAEREGPGPLVGSSVRIRQLSVFREWRAGVGEEKPDVRPEVLPEDALPWVDLEPTVQLENEIAGIYLSYVLDRPDSIIAALRTIAESEGAALVHCAAGKDRTGTVVALALTLAGVEREAIIADYAASSDRVERIVARLVASPTYAENLRDRPMDSHRSWPQTMSDFLGHVDETYGGVEQLLLTLGWTADDTARLRAKLLDA